MLNHNQKKNKSKNLVSRNIKDILLWNWPPWLRLGWTRLRKRLDYNIGWRWGHNQGVSEGVPRPPPLELEHPEHIRYPRPL